MLSDNIFTIIILNNFFSLLPFIYPCFHSHITGIKLAIVINCINQVIIINDYLDCEKYIPINDSSEIFHANVTNLTTSFNKVLELLLLMVLAYN